MAAVRSRRGGPGELDVVTGGGRGGEGEQRRTLGREVAPFGGREAADRADVQDRRRAGAHDSPGGGERAVEEDRAGLFVAVAGEALGGEVGRRRRAQDPAAVGV